MSRERMLFVQNILFIGRFYKASSLKS